MLALTAVCAIVFSVFGLAVRGSQWAAAVSIGIGSLVVLMLVYASVFAAVWVYSEVITAWERRRGARSGSPFRSPSPAAGHDAGAENIPVAAVLSDESPVEPQRP